MQRQQNVTQISVFYSYAHEDEALRQQLETHLALLGRQGFISEWHDRKILPGAEWAQEIDEHLERASIILLLISPDFLASDYCYDIEMQRALERHKRGEARVIPIILRPCDWHTSPFARLQSLPRDGKAITTWQNQDEAFLTIAEGLRRVIERQQIPTRPLSHVERQNRTRLMKRVRATWIEGVLEHSLHQAALIALDLQEQPDALANPWHLEVQETNLPPHPLPAGTSILQVYDEADGELLILGEPGAGKTTLLLELARVLLDRAEADERHRIPVVFNLSSWAEKRPPLPEWLVEELWTKYQVPHKIGQSWVAADQILPLLDGLDEVAVDARPDCVQAINTYYQKRLEERSVLMVVCCRIEEYMALSTRVTLRQAVSIQPLTQQQIDHYLQNVKGQLEGLRQALRDDPESKEMASKPLMLSVLTLAYQGKSVEDLLTIGSPDLRRRHVFTTYVQRMLHRRGTDKRYTAEQTIHWLAWLARQLAQHSQAEFYIERMQPNWLSLHSRSYRLYRVLVRLVAGLLIGISVGPFVGLLYGPFVGILAGLVSWLMGGSIGWLFSLLVYQSGREIKPVEVVAWSGIRLQGGLMGSSRMRLVAGIFSGMVGLLTAGLFIGLTSGPRTGLISGLVVGTFNVLFTWLCMGLLGGLSSKMLSKHDRTVPNQGIHRSMLNSLLVGLCFGLICGLVNGLGIGLVSMSVTGHPVGVGFELSFGLSAGLVCGVGAAMPNGGLASIQHVLLRLLLWRAGSTPLNYPQFLDYATERILLRKVGGGYIFIHRLLQDYFADLETAPLPNGEATQAQQSSTTP